MARCKTYHYANYEGVITAALVGKRLNFEQLMDASGLTYKQLRTHLVKYLRSGSVVVLQYNWDGKGDAKYTYALQGDEFARPSYTPNKPRTVKVTSDKKPRELRHQTWLSLIGG